VRNHSRSDENAFSDLSELMYSATMRNLRSFAVLALSIAPLTAWVAGCGGDDSSSGTPDTPDSSNNTSSSSGSVSGDSSTPDSNGPQAPSAKATSVTLYIGNVARLDGSTSTGAGTLTYAWGVKTVPAGSTIATANLTGANAATVTFTPDKIGVYELELTVTAGAQTSKATVTATVVDPPVFYYENADDAGTNTARLLVGGATAGDGGKPVACFERDAGTYATYTRYTASGGTDWWEAPAGQPSKVAFIMESTIDGGQLATLYGTTSAGSCATPPTKLDFIAPSGAAGRGYEQPRISPDGNRVAFVRQAAGEGTRIATIGFTGTGLRVLAARNADNDGGADPDAGLSPVSVGSRPFWMGNTHVAWIESVTGDRWQVVRAADGANPTREIVMTCNGQTPSQGEVLANGDVLVTQGIASGGVQLVAYPVVAATKACGTPRVLVPVPDGGAGFAQDFMLSPDGKEVAYWFSDALFGPTVSEIRAVKVDGTGSPRKVGELGSPQRGARWIASGSMVSWGASGPQVVDAGFEAGTVIAVAPADGGSDGGPVKVAAQGATAQSIGNGLFQCDIGHAAGSGVAFFGIAGVALLRTLRRRRR
jgi:hypothetical protein